MKYAVILAIAVGLITIGTTNSFAQTTTPVSSGDPIYMNYDNLNIKGDVTSISHPQWIEINSFQWGVGRTISAPTGGYGVRQASAPSVSENVITKPQDSSSVGLLREAFGGTGKTVIIDFVKTDLGKEFTYLEYKLDNVLVSSYSVSSGGDRPSESISLSFTKITFIFNPQNPDGSPGTPSLVAYDIALARVS